MTAPLADLAPLDAGLVLDDVIPRPDHRSRHQRHISEPPDQVWTALLTASIDAHPVARFLMGARKLPTRFLGPRPSTGRQPRTLVEMAPYPIVSMTPGRGIVIAGIGQPWKLNGDHRPPHLSAADLARFATPGWAKVAMDVRIAPADGGAVISTETRVVATDERSRRSFGVYWNIIRVPSGVLRRLMLSAVAADAQLGTNGGRSLAPGSVDHRPWQP